MNSQTPSSKSSTPLRFAQDDPQREIFKSGEHPHHTAFFFAPMVSKKKDKAAQRLLRPPPRWKQGGALRLDFSLRPRKRAKNYFSQPYHDMTMTFVRKGSVNMVKKHKKIRGSRVYFLLCSFFDEFFSEKSYTFHYLQTWRFCV